MTQDSVNAGARTSSAATYLARPERTYPGYVYLDGSGLLGPAGHGQVAQAGPGQPLGVEHVPAVEDERGAHDDRELGPVEVEVLRPGSGQDQRLGAVGDLLRGVAQIRRQLRVLGPDPSHRHRVVQPDPRTALQQRTGDVEGRRVAEVVG